MTNSELIMLYVCSGVQVMWQGLRFTFRLACFSIILLSFGVTLHPSVVVLSRTETGLYNLKT